MKYLVSSKINKHANFNVHENYETTVIPPLNWLYQILRNNTTKICKCVYNTVLYYNTFWLILSK